MSETLASATRAVAKLLPHPHIYVEGAATGSGAVGKTTLVDSAAWFVSPTTLPPDDYFNGGTIWFIDAVTGTSNDGDTAIITDYTSSTGTYTFAAIDAQTLTGDTYAACPRFYPRFILRQAVNHALSEVGGEDLQNTSLTSVANQMTYDLPAGVYNVQRVEVATSTATPYDYITLNHWREINDDISFDEHHQLTTAGFTIRLTYRVPFADLTTDAGALPDLVDMNWIKWAGAAYCLRWRYSVETDEEIRNRLVEALTNAEKMADRFRPKMQQMQRDWPHSAWDTGWSVGESDIYTGTVRV